MEINPNKYHKSNAIQTKDGMNLINKIVAENNDYDIVLDIGCGTGNLTLLLSNKLNANHIYGIDIDENMISFAKQNHMKDNISYLGQDFGLEFDLLCSELRSLEGKVSLIFSNYCLHWIQNKTNVVKNLYRLLSKKGKMYTNIAYIPNPYHDLSAEEKVIHEKEFMKVPERETQINIWLNLFTSIGFNDISSQLLSEKYIFELEFYIQTFMELVPVCYRQYFVGNLDYLVKEKSEEIKNRFLALYKTYQDETNGKTMIEMNYELFEFIIQIKD